MQDGKVRSKLCRLTVFWVGFREQTVPAVKSDDDTMVSGVVFFILVLLLKQAGVSI